MSTQTWQKPVHWWMPWRRRALRREWDRQARIAAMHGDSYWIKSSWRP